MNSEVTPTGVRNPPDIITLNVGGKHFTTCISTLTKYSSYFEAMFSRHWNNTNDHVNANGTDDNDDDNDDYNDDNDNDEPTTNPPNSTMTEQQRHQHPESSSTSTSASASASLAIFIDKDPTPFQYILNYMREGYLDLPEDDFVLSKSIIIQAQFFGLDDFISHVKMISIANTLSIKERKDFDVGNDNDYDSEDITTSLNERAREHDHEHLVRIFDSKYGNLFDAFDEGLLPHSYFDQCNDRISLQVGDKIYTLSKQKLIEKSPFIRQMICHSPSKKEFFIDQDPNSFDYLLHYIRYSQIVLPPNDPYLFRRVLRCAEYLQMDDFIIFVKARTMINIEHHEAPGGLDSIADEYSPYALLDDATHMHRHYEIEFNSRFSSINHAFAESILPNRFFRS